MANVAEVIDSLQETSKVLSSKGAQEEAQLQEALIQLLGFMVLEQRQPTVVAIEKAPSVKFKPHQLADFKAFFEQADVQAAIDESGSYMSVLYYVPTAEECDFVPMFLTNYLSVDMFPAVFTFCVERLELKSEQGVARPFYTLPYFTITKFNGETPDPTLGFVGQALRLRALEEQDAVVAEASGNIEPYLRVSAMMLQGQGALV